MLLLRTGAQMMLIEYVHALCIFYCLTHLHTGKQTHERIVCASTSVLRFCTDEIDDFLLWIIWQGFSQRKVDEPAALLHQSCFTLCQRWQPLWEITDKTNERAAMISHCEQSSAEWSFTKMLNLTLPIKPLKAYWFVLNACTEMQKSPEVSAIVSANVWIAQSTFLHRFKETREDQWSPDLCQEVAWSIIRRVTRSLEKEWKTFIP